MNSKFLSRIATSLLLSLGTIILTFGVLATQAKSASSIIFVAQAATGNNTGISWTHAYTDLRTALATAQTGDQIWVATGVYTPGASRGDSFVLKGGISLFGGFAGTETSLEQRDWQANLTVLSGDIGVIGDTSDNSSHVVSAQFLYDEPAGLDGFIVTGGNSGSSGGGIFNQFGSPTIRNCLIKDNLAQFGGGMFNRTGSPTLINVTFENNRSDSQSGGGLYNQSSVPILINTAFYSNSAKYEGGAMYNYLGSAPIIINSIFKGNSVRYLDGAGIYNDTGSSPTLINVVFYGNEAPYGAALCSHQATPVVVNTIFWNNTDTPLCNFVSPDITYSIVQGGFLGEGNLDVDPQFVDPDHGDFRLKPTSPAIDAGNNSAVPADMYDLDQDGDTTEAIPLDYDGNLRFTDVVSKTDTGLGTVPIVDLGIFEAAGSAEPGPVQHPLFLPVVFK